MTEEITGVDIVQAQMKIAAGVTLPEMGLTQDEVRARALHGVLRYRFA